MGINGTWLGGLVAHLILVPLWTLSPTFPMIAIGFLFCGGAWTALGAAMLLLVLFLNNKTFAYRPWVVHWLYDKDLTGYYRKCRLAGPHLDSLPKSKALYSELSLSCTPEPLRPIVCATRSTSIACTQIARAVFHPHGVLSVGFVVNGCWSRHFNALTTKQDVDVPKSTGTVFLIAKSLREWMSFFKVLCDFSGRLESATKDAIFKVCSHGMCSGATRVRRHASCTVRSVHARARMHTRERWAPVCTHRTKYTRRRWPHQHNARARAAHQRRADALMRVLDLLCQPFWGATCVHLCASESGRHRLPVAANGH